MRIRYRGLREGANEDDAHTLPMRSPVFDLFILTQASNSASVLADILPHLLELFPLVEKSVGTATIKLF